MKVYVYADESGAFDKAHTVAYVDSSKVPLVRAADITANWMYMAVRDKESYPFAYDAALQRVDVLELPG